MASSFFLSLAVTFKLEPTPAGSRLKDFMLVLTAAWRNYQAYAVSDNTAKSSEAKALWYPKSNGRLSPSDFDRNLLISNGKISWADGISNLGVYLDNNVNMKIHVAKVVSACLYQLRPLQWLHGWLARHGTTHPVVLLVLLRLDHSDAALVGLPWSSRERLHCIIRAAACLVCRLHPHDRIASTLCDLYWLSLAAMNLLKYTLCILVSQLPLLVAPCITLYHSGAIQFGLFSLTAFCFRARTVRTAQTAQTG